MESIWFSKASFVIIQLITLSAAIHAILYKRDSRAALGWVALIFFSPGIGAIFYFWFGINRVQRKAQKLLQKKTVGAFPAAPDELTRQIEKRYPLAEFVGKINEGPVTENQLEILVNGEQAYPRMLQAIDSAKETVFLGTYIFDNDSTGREFAKALQAAGERGVLVRILIDAVGARYSFPSIFRFLKGKNLKATRFLNTFIPWRFHYSQLRNHRKLLLIDGKLAFTGGMNIREGHVVKGVPSSRAIQDLQFQIKGPMISQLYRVFLDDWEFATREKLEVPLPLIPKSSRVVTPILPATLSRLIVHGPDEDFDKLRWTLLGAITSARHSISILTPYFVPDSSILTALGIASLRGVRVEILLPEVNNLRLVQWASFALLWQILETGCLVYLSPPPFDHSKLMIIDDYWSFMGSANWDSRSFRLNFELNIENYDKNLAAALQTLFDEKKKTSRLVSLKEMDSRPFWKRLRDGTARLFSPYL